MRIEDGDEPTESAVTPDGKGASAHSKVAVRFDKISEADQERIACYILSAHRLRAADRP